MGACSGAFRDESVRVIKPYTKRKTYGFITGKVTNTQPNATDSCKGRDLEELMPDFVQPA